MTGKLHFGWEVPFAILLQITVFSLTFSSQGYFSTPLSPLSKSAVQSAITTTFQGESPGYIEMAGITGSKDLEQKEEVIFEIISAVTQQKRTDR